MRRHLLFISLTAVLMTACSDTEAPSNAELTGTVETVSTSVATTDTTTTQEPDVIRYPTILAADLKQDSDGTWSVAVTLSSTYDTPERYADGWRVLDEQENIIGDRPLGHDHQSEQPFTRSTSGVAIPEGSSTVTIEARDQQYGWSPDTFSVEVPRN